MNLRRSAASSVESGAHGTLLAVTHAAIPALNPVLSSASEPDDSEIAVLASTATQKAGQAPWSIRVREEPSDAVRRIADRHGLVVASRQPFMLLPLAPRGGPAVRVRRLTGKESTVFARILGAGFGAPPQIVEAIYTPEVLDHPLINAYAAEDELGASVSAGVSFLNDGYLGIGNLATVPELQHHGFGQAVAETILREGRAAGAHTAYLHSTDAALDLFERLGFRTVEHWTTLSAF